MKIIITGGRGFVGKAICKKLKDTDNEIHTIGRSKNFSKYDFPENCIHHCIDLAKDPLPKFFLKKRILYFMLPQKLGYGVNILNFIHRMFSQRKNFSQIA